MENEIIRKAEELPERCKTVVLSTLDGEGCPCPVVMATLHTEKLDVWVATSAGSRKARHLRANPCAGTFYTGEKFITVDL